MSLLPEQLPAAPEDRPVPVQFCVSRRHMLRWMLSAPAALAVTHIAGERAALAAAPASPTVPRGAAEPTAAAAPAPKAGPKTAPEAGAFKLPPLSYGYAALGRAIDETTMRLHHDKHHQAYVDKLNAAISKAPMLKGKSAQTLLMDLNNVPETVREAVRNNGGGHVNHSMFWEIMSPAGGGAPGGDVGKLITANFGSFETFKSKFEEAGVKRFGSGWVWLVLDGTGAKIISTPNQDNPISTGMFPLLGNDVWEHAYYLRYQNRRAEYLKAWWQVVNWDAVNARLRYANKVKASPPAVHI